MSPKSDSGIRKSRSDAFVHVRLTGPVAVRAYSFWNAIRLGNVTLVVGDASAARGISLLALLLQDVAPGLGHTYVGRRVDKTPATEVTALVSLRGNQPFSDFTITPAAAAHDRCGEMAVTVGSFRLTLRDRTAAEAVARVLVLTYEDAHECFRGLSGFAEFREVRDNRRSMNKGRRSLPV